MATFSRRHYLYTAQFLATIKSEQLRYNVASELIKLFEEDNKLFDAELFIKNSDLTDYIRNHSHS